MFEHLKRDWAYGVRFEVENMKARREPRSTCSTPWLRADGSKMLPNEQIFPGEEPDGEQPRRRIPRGSWDWLVAYAVHLGAVEITLHGVYLSLDSARDEPISARACLEYWIGYAEGKGPVGLFDCDLMYQYHLVRSPHGLRLRRRGGGRGARHPEVRSAADRVEAVNAVAIIPARGGSRRIPEEEHPALPRQGDPRVPSTSACARGKGRRYERDRRLLARALRRGLQQAQRRPRRA
jgi:hypothetical protein